MTRIVYPNERKLLSVDLEAGTAKVWQGALEYETETSDWEGHKTVFGGMGAAEVTLPIRAVMTRKEHRQITSFLKFRRRYDREIIPVIKEDIKREMIKRFGTMDLKVLQSRLFIEAQSDTRLYIKTRNGNTIKTTVAEQAQYIGERNAAMTGNHRNE